VGLTVDRASVTKRKNDFPITIQIFGSGIWTGFGRSRKGTGNIHLKKKDFGRGRIKD